MLNLFHRPKHGLHQREFLVFNIQKDSDLEKKSIFINYSRKAISASCSVELGCTSHTALHFSGNLALS